MEEGSQRERGRRRERKRKRKTGWMGVRRSGRGGGEEGRRGREGWAEVNLVHLYAHHLKAGREGG